MRSAHNPGPTNDQEALQEEFLGALQALGARRAMAGCGSC
jgi:hypothetical protein